MTKAEIIEFLELPSNITDKDIAKRANEKLQYFNRLIETAPNEVLKKVYQKNKEKILSIQSQTNFQYSEATNTHFGNSSANYAEKKVQPIAWLIRHTEYQEAKNFPIYLGINIIGRVMQSGKNSILFEQDAFVSRRHAVLYAHNPTNFTLEDSVSANEGKASKNGTYLNGNPKRINQKISLKDGDTIQVGNTKLVFRLNDEPIHKIINEVEEADYMNTVVINIM